MYLKAYKNGSHQNSIPEMFWKDRLHHTGQYYLSMRYKSELWSRDNDPLMMFKFGSPMLNGYNHILG